MKELNRYIDICLIDEYANKNVNRGYSLDIDSLPEHERSNFLDELMKNDTTVKDLVLFHMQKLIDERLSHCESKDRDLLGISVVRMSNGDEYLGDRKW